MLVADLRHVRRFVVANDAWPLSAPILVSVAVPQVAAFDGRDHAQRHQRTAQIRRRSGVEAP